MTFDAAVIGAGIVGAACAFECARAGLRVAVLEQSFPASGATAAGMGHIVVMDDSEAQFALTKYSVALWRALVPDLPPSVEYLPCGTIWVAANEDEMVEVHRKHRFYSARGVAAEALDRQQLHYAEPGLSPGLPGALFIPDDSVLYPPCATSFLLTHPLVTSITKTVTKVTEGMLRFADESTLSAAAIVNAAGISAPQLTPELPLIQPRKGHLLITDRHPGVLHHQLVELGYLKSAHSVEADSIAFNVQPRSNGQILIGSSRQFGAASSGIDRAILSAMLRRAVEFMPGLAHLSAIRGWTGFRASTADKLPLIGICPGYRNVYIAAGHEGLGITTSLATGRLIADRVLGRASAIPFEPYLPERTPVHA